MKNPALQRTLFFLFFLSGFCSLLYQVVWLRMAFAAFGVVTPVLSVVLSVFMLGLAGGTWIGGRFVKSLTQKTGISPLQFYAICEMLIGVGAFLVPWGFTLSENYLLTLGEVHSAKYLFYSAIAITFSILPWCLLMGATFPLVMAFLRDVEGESHSFSFLYLANVTGAMIGTSLTALVFVELLGFSNTLLVAALGNFLIAWIAFRTSQRFGTSCSREEESTHSIRPTLSLKENYFIYLVLLISGFSSMAMEVIWTRAFTPTLLTTVYAFAFLLTTYLCATWLGSLHYRIHLKTKQILSTSHLMILLPITALLPILLNDPRFTVKVVAALSSIFPFSYLLGYLTPKLIDRYSFGNPKYAGLAYGLNIIGGILGPLVAGYWLLPTLGVRYSLILLGLPFFLLGFTLLPSSKSLVFKFGGSATMISVLFISIFFCRTYEERTDGLMKRDHTATVIAHGEGYQKGLLVNGIGITAMTPVTKAMAHLPVMHAENPKSALVICFGMGTTFRSLASWDLEVTAVELVESVRDVFPYFFNDALQLMKDPRLEIVVDDGRRFLKRTPKMFDIITLDPPPPVEAAGSSLLYSKEFYEVAKKRMNRGAILQQWFPGGERKVLRAVASAIDESFPYVKVFHSLENWGYHFLASESPIPVREAQLYTQIPVRVEQDLLEWSKDLNLSEIVHRMLSKEIPMSAVRGTDFQLLTDDRPFNEYYALRRNLDRLLHRYEGS